MKLSHYFLKTVLPDAHCMQGALSETHNYFFSIDSRTIQENELFIPIKGEHVDGHAFLKDALLKGCGAFVAKKQLPFLNEVLNDLSRTKIIIIVTDPEKAFLDLTAAWRARFEYPVIGITGSVGKTSTKTLLARIMKRAGKKCFVSEGNQNTLIGVSLNIARLNDEYDCALFECGVSKSGEMALISGQLQPTTGIITGVGHSHLEGLGGIESIASEKKALFKWFKETNIGIINGDMASLSKSAYVHPVIRFGEKTSNQIQARKIKNADGGHLSFILKIYKNAYFITIKDGHPGCVTLILAATAMAYYLGISEDIIVSVIQEPFLPARRFETKAMTCCDGVMIDDAYNASPESMKAALLAFEKLKNEGKKIAILGDMLELGTTSSFWHRQIGRFLRKVPSLNQLILVGNEVEWIQRTVSLNIQMDKVSSWEEALEIVKNQVCDGDMILVKGSHGMQLGKLVDACCQKES